MTASAETSRFAAVIGDVVGSRRAGDRRRAQRVLSEALARVNQRVPARSPLEPTVGDEFQGLYASLAEAFRAILLLRVMLKGELELRFGVGQGEVLFFEDTPRTQDGPAWWGAREAIDRVRALEDTKGAPHGLRTAFVAREEVDRSGRQAELPGIEDTLPTPGSDLVNAALTALDELVTMMDERDARILLGLLEGRTNARIAEEEGVTASAVSQRARGAGIYAALRCSRLLERALSDAEPGRDRP